MGGGFLNYCKIGGGFPQLVPLYTTTEALHINTETSRICWYERKKNSVYNTR